MAIKYATIDDLEQIHALSAFWDEVNAEPVDFDVLRGYVELETVICAEDDENIVGITMLEENTDQSIHVARFFVHPDFRDNGIGSEMMDKVTSILDHNCTTAFTSVAMTNPAINLYERYGFIESSSFAPPTDEHIVFAREPSS